MIRLVLLPGRKYTLTCNSVIYNLHVYCIVSYYVSNIILDLVFSANIFNKNIGSLVI